MDLGTKVSLLLLPLLVPTLMFTLGANSISALGVPSLVMMLIFALEVGHAAWLFLLWPCVALGLFGGFCLVFEVALIWTVAGAATLIGGAICLLALAPSRRLAQRLPTHAHLNAVIFPTLLAAFYLMLGRASPYGSFGDFGYVLGADFFAMRVFSSLFGLSGMTFVAGWIARVSTMFIQHMWGGKGDPGAHPPPQPRPPAGWSAAPYGPARALVAALLVAMVYGSARTLNAYGQFFQKDVSQWQGPYFNAACIIATQRDFSGDSNFTDFVPAAYREPREPSAAPRLLLFSEAAFFVREAHVERLLDQARGYALGMNVTIGLGYRLYFSDERRERSGYADADMFALIVPGSRSAGFRYQKVTVIQGFETEEPGQGRARPADTDLGRIGVGITWDYDFPAYLRAAAAGADLMLQPAWLGGSLGEIHARHTAFRAAENGVTIFRCSSGSLSGVWDRYGRKVFSHLTAGYGHDRCWDAYLECRSWALQGECDANPGFMREYCMPSCRLCDDRGETNNFQVAVPREPRIFTLYSVIGDAFGWLCLVGAIPLWIMALLPEKEFHDDASRMGLEPGDARVSSLTSAE